MLVQGIITRVLSEKIRGSMHWKILWTSWNYAFKKRLYMGKILEYHIETFTQEHFYKEKNEEKLIFYFQLKKSGTVFLIQIL